MAEQIFLSPQVKRSAIIRNKVINWYIRVALQFAEQLKLRILGN